METQYWLGVASYDHVRKGVAGGFCQFDHGKSHTVKKLRKGDRIVYYSPRESINAGAKVQAFTALGEVLEGEMEQVEACARRQVRYQQIEPAPIQPLLEDLSFIKNKQSWGLALRRSSLQLSRDDFERIARALSKG